MMPDWTRPVLVFGPNNQIDQPGEQSMDFFHVMNLILESSSRIV